MQQLTWNIHVRRSRTEENGALNWPNVQPRFDFFQALDEIKLNTSFVSVKELSWCRYLHLVIIGEVSNGFWFPSIKDRTDQPEGSLFLPSCVKKSLHLLATKHAQYFWFVLINVNVIFFDLAMWIHLSSWIQRVKLEWSRSLWSAVYWVTWVVKTPLVLHLLFPGGQITHTRRTHNELIVIPKIFMTFLFFF